MNLETPPHGDMTGHQITSFETGRNDVNTNTKTKTKTIPSKCNATPFAEQIYKQAKLWHVYIGEDAIDRAVNDYEIYGPWKIAVMPLPWKTNPFDYQWPVLNKTVDILSAGKHSLMVQHLGDALSHCGALNVYGRVNGEIVHWNNSIMEAA